MFRRLKKIFTVRVRRKRIKIRFTQAHYEAYKESARSLVHEYIQKHNREEKFKIGKISIRNQTSRWGSCSLRGNLNFNVRLVLLPPQLAEYIVVHELSHTKEHNHGKKFWDEVADILPDYKERRYALRQWEKEQFQTKNISTML